MKLALLLLISAIPAYVLGSVNGAIITSKLLYRKDIRDYGSGNPGLTNFYRVFGKGGSLLVVAIDVAKTIGPVFLGGFLFAHYYDADMQLFGKVATGFFVMLGHCFPLFYRFIGGKGVMAIGAILFIVDWRLALIAWGTFIALTAATRYVSLGAMIGVATYPAFMAVFCVGGVPEIVAASLCAVLLIARHHANIRRLFKGEESKFSFRRKSEVVQ
jgi:glycerol-3-phosphate acyltransferase PlsY